MEDGRSHPDDGASGQGQRRRNGDEARAPTRETTTTRASSSIKRGRPTRRDRVIRHQVLSRNRSQNNGWSVPAAARDRGGRVRRPSSSKKTPSRHESMRPQRKGPETAERSVEMNDVSAMDVGADVITTNKEEVRKHPSGCERRILLRQSDKPFRQISRFDRQCRGAGVEPLDDRFDHARWGHRARKRRGTEVYADFRDFARRESWLLGLAPGPSLASYARLSG